MIGLMIYFFAGILSSYLFLSRQTWRLDAMDMMGAVMVLFGWPIYIPSILVMRHFNGDWR